MLGKTRTVLKILNLLNWTLAAAMMLGCLTMGFVLADRTAALVARIHPGLFEPADALLVLRLVVLVLPVMAWLVHRVLRGLIAIIDTIPAGQAFSAANAARLHGIARDMLAINVVDLLFGLFAYSRLGPFSGWNFTLSGWVACLMLFVLAGVWQQGVAMRDELEGTV